MYIEINYNSFVDNIKIKNVLNKIKLMKYIKQQTHAIIGY